jgi:hypothetical protein
MNPLARRRNLVGIVRQPLDNHALALAQCGSQGAIPTANMHHKAAAVFGERVDVLNLARIGCAQQ